MGASAHLADSWHSGAVSRLVPPAAALRKGAVLAVVLMAPLVVVGVIAGGKAVLPAGMALMSAAVLPYCDRKQAVVLGAGLVLTGVLATAAQGTMWAVVVVVVAACLVAGLASKVSAGVYGLAPIAAVSLGLEPQELSPLGVGAVMAVVCAYVGLIIVLRGFHVTPHPIPLAVGIRHGVVMAVACGSATVVVMHFGWPHGYWLVMTLAIVLRPYAKESLQRTVQRIAGTVAGALIAAALSVAPRPWQLVFAAICLALMFTFMAMRDYLMQVTFTTPMVVFLVSSGTVTDTLTMDWLRVVYTAAACVIGGALALLLARQDDA